MFFFRLEDNTIGSKAPFPEWFLVVFCSLLSRSMLHRDLIFIPPVLTVRLVILVHRMELLEFNEKNNHLLAWRLSESKHSACKNPLCGTWRGNKGARKAHNLTPDSLRTTTKMRRKMRELTNFVQQITT